MFKPLSVTLLMAAVICRIALSWLSLDESDPDKSRTTIVSTWLEMEGQIEANSLSQRLDKERETWKIIIAARDQAIGELLSSQRRSLFEVAHSLEEKMLRVYPKRLRILRQSVNGHSDTERVARYLIMHATTWGNKIKPLAEFNERIQDLEKELAEWFEGGFRPRQLAVHRPARPPLVNPKEIDQPLLGRLPLPQAERHGPASQVIVHALFVSFHHADTPGGEGIAEKVRPANPWICLALFRMTTA
jgi:hypothetical protein